MTSGDTTQLHALARQILRNNKFTTLGSIVQEDIPWVSCVYYIWDDGNTSLYFRSDPSTRHIQNTAQTTAFEIHENPEPGEVTGVQGVGKVSLITDNEVTHAENLYLKKRNSTAPIEHQPETALWKWYVLRIDRVFFVDSRFTKRRRVDVWSRETHERTGSV